MQSSIAILGYGNLGQSIVKGLLTSGNYQKSDLILLEKNEEIIAKATKEGFQINEDLSSIKEIKQLIICVKPHACLSILEKIKPFLDISKAEVVSFVSMITLEQMNAIIGENCKVIRAMTNLATGQNTGVVGYSILGNTISKEIQVLLESIGWIKKMEEEMLDALTVISGCGLGFVLRYIRALSQAALQIGFDVQTAEKVVRKTIEGSLSILESGEHPEEIIDRVTTPRGLTIYGLNEMEHNGFSSALIKAVVATYDKMK